ncbi:MAG: agmatine deiminase family protein [Deltaproteobacteria bacterium]|nr:MAG: agmatine deiminase family protein [Deltaproteobacteria bacterium]
MTASATLAPEWAPHAATWTAWPSHHDLWGDDLAGARAAVAALGRALVDAGERVDLLVLPGSGAPVPGATARPAPFGDIWLRDTGPIFVRRAGVLEAARFRWNGWGGKYLLDHDAEVGDAIARWAGAAIRRHGWVLEGGAIDVDGTGRCLTTRQCLLNPNRNPGMDAPAVEGALRDALGVDRVLWLGDGLINDHTDGHVDNLARFVAPGVAMCMEPGPGDPNREVLAAAMRDLRRFGLEVIAVPSPGRVDDRDGRPLPASYLNFYIGNGVVAVPTFGVAADDAALAAIEAAFPGRRVAGIPARALLAGGGALHCITKEQPA